jgi:hypothetical protein
MHPSSIIADCFHPEPKTKDDHDDEDWGAKHIHYLAKLAK